MNEVSLIYNNNSYRGPGKVASNLIRGLEKIGVQVHHNEIIDGAPIGILQAVDGRSLIKVPATATAGPNLFVLPSDRPDIVQRFKRFVVPSEWVKRKYQSFDVMRDKHIDVWPVGIDADNWHPESPENGYVSDCFIYFKNRSEKELEIVKKMCAYYNQSYRVLEYGNYTEQQLKEHCRTSKYAMLLTGTESQGIAVGEILSTNTPCFVFNQPHWTDNHSTGYVKYDATSVPYFDYRCGEVVDKVDLKQFGKFLEKVGTEMYEPRKYVLENLTLEKAAEEYMNIVAYDNS